MARFSGRRYKGAMRVYKEAKREEAEQRHKEEQARDAARKEEQDDPPEWSDKDLARRILNDLRRRTTNHAQ